jgi:tetratricopeptide (TPR) repeat protein
MRSVMTGMILMVGICAARGADAPPADASGALGWRLDGVSSGQLGPNQPDAAWKRSIALLEAAQRLNPKAPRFPRLIAMARLHVNDPDGAIEAVRAYRKLAPADRQAQVQLIDLYAGKMETVDAKLTYLRGLVEKEDLAPEIRAHVASRCAALLLQRSRQEAAHMAKRAVELYPLAEATGQYYELAGRELEIGERVKALAAVLKANPDQVGYLNEMAGLLAGEGLTEQSIDWYGAALSVIMRSGPSRPAGFHDLLINYASAQIIAGKISTADSFLGQMLQEMPRDPDAWFLKLTLVRMAPSQTSNEQILEMARNALVGRWNAVHDEILNPATSQPAAASQPADAAAAKDAGPPGTMPAKIEPADPGAVVAKLKGGDNPDAKSAAVGALSDLAWFEVYYANQPAAAKRWIDTLSQIGAEEALVTRLNGWSALQAGQVGQAREILGKIAEGDALARLGVIKVDEGEKKPVDEEAVRKLLDGHRVGLVGAVLWEALRGTKVSPTTRSSASGIASALASFPKDWLMLWDQRAARRVYDLRIEPVTTNVAYGDPLLFTMTVRNAGSQDIEIGADALLRPDLWFDGQILGMDRRTFRGVAYDQLGGEIVLRPRATTSQVVRMDVGELRAALAGNVGTMTRVNGDVVTNPLIASGGAVPGPGGLAANFDRSGVLVGIQVGTAAGRKQLDGLLASTAPVDRLHAADVIAGVNLLAGKKDASPELKKLAGELNASLVKLRADGAAAVSGWASYLEATTAVGEQGGTVPMEMAKSGEWTTRLLSLFVGGRNQKDVAGALVEDADATVKEAAGATVELLNAPTTQAATQPSSMPAGAGG